MKIENLINETFDNNKISWNGNPIIGWHNTTRSPIFYYGTMLSNVKKCFMEGIKPPVNGNGIIVSIEPNTALAQATLRQHINETKINTTQYNKAVIKLTIPDKYLTDYKLIIENGKEKLTNRKLYEKWGKSDVEYYALINVHIPMFIPPEYITGYMIR